METLVIFNGIITPSSLNTSDWFIEGDFFYIEAFNIQNGELEIDCFLNVEITNNLIRVIEIEKDNVADTERLIFIPKEFRDSTYRKRLVFLPSEELSVKVTVVTTESSCDRTEDLAKANLDLAKSNLILSTYNIQQNAQTNTALAAFSVSIGLAIPSGGASLIALPETVLPILTPIPIPIQIPVPLPVLP